MKFLFLAVFTVLSTFSVAKTYLIEPKIHEDEKLWSWGYISYNDASGFGKLRLSPLEIQIPFSDKKLIPARLIGNILIDGEPKDYQNFIKTAVADIDDGDLNFQLQFLDKKINSSSDDLREKGMCKFDSAEFWAQCRVQGLFGVKQINYRDSTDEYLSGTVAYAAFPMSISLDTGNVNDSRGRLTFGFSPVANYIDSQKMIDTAELGAKANSILLSLDAIVGYQISENFMLQFGSSLYSHEYNGKREITSELSYRF